MQLVEQEIEGRTYRGVYTLDSDGFVVVIFGERSDKADSGAVAEATAKRVLKELVLKSQDKMA